jgi:hypothetical protein
VTAWWEDYEDRAPMIFHDRRGEMPTKRLVVGPDPKADTNRQRTLAVSIYTTRRPWPSPKH